MINDVISLMLNNYEKELFVSGVMVSRSRLLCDNQPSENIKPSMHPKTHQKI